LSAWIHRESGGDNRLDRLLANAKGLCDRLFVIGVVYHGPGESLDLPDVETPHRFDLPDEWVIITNRLEGLIADGEDDDLAGTNRAQERAEVGRCLGVTPRVE